MSLQLKGQHGTQEKAEGKKEEGTMTEQREGKRRNGQEWDTDLDSGEGDATHS